MAKAEALYNVNNSKGTAKIFSFISKTTPGGSAPNKLMAENAVTAYEIGEEAVETIKTASETIAEYVLGVINFFIHNWEITIVGIVAFIILLRRI